MTANDGIVVPITIPAAQLEMAVKAAVQFRADEIDIEFKRSLALKSDEFHRLNQALEDRVDGGRDRIDKKMKEIETGLEVGRDRIEKKATKIEADLDGLQKKVNERVNTYVVPAVILTFCALCFAAFTAVGGFGVITKIEGLKQQVKQAEQSFNSTQTDLASLKEKITSATALADSERIANLQKQLDEEKAKEAATLKRLDAIEAAQRGGNRGGAHPQSQP
jgi:uncharacterized phage infection (PIP) family protein YhgE